MVAFGTCCHLFFAPEVLRWPSAPAEILYFAPEVM